MSAFNPKRVWIMPTLACGLLCLLALRMFDLQVVNAAVLRQTAESNRFFHKTVVADRGILFDRFGQPLVFNKPVFYQLKSPNHLYSDRTLVDESTALGLMATARVAMIENTFLAGNFMAEESKENWGVGIFDRYDSILPSSSIDFPLVRSFQTREDS